MARNNVSKEAVGGGRGTTREYLQSSDRIRNDRTKLARKQLSNEGKILRRNLRGVGVPEEIIEGVEIAQLREWNTLIEHYKNDIPPKKPTENPPQSDQATNQYPRTRRAS